MGWLSNSGSVGADGTTTPETSSDTDRSLSPNNTINTSSNNNAQLLTKLSTMEATHLNQLHEVTTQMAEREKEREMAYKEEVQARDVQLQQAQVRIESVERRIRERDAQLSSVKEEKAGCMRQIADLKNQLYQLVSCLRALNIMCAYHVLILSCNILTPL